MRDIARTLGRLKHTSGGNFGVMSALLLPILLGTAGMAIDATNLVMTKTELQAATDAAALAVSTALADGKVTETTGKTMGQDFVVAQIINYVDASSAAAIRNATSVGIVTTTTSTGKTFNVTVGSSAAIALTPLTGILFGKVASVSASSKTTSGVGSTRTGLSMELLLDESGSMGDIISRCLLGLGSQCLIYAQPIVTKMDALKQATTALFDALDKSDPNNKYVRTGTISYTAASPLQASSIKGQSPVDWGTTGSRTYVAAMPKTPAGGTDATASVDTATTNIAKNQYGTDPESVAQAKKNNTTSDRVIILMTDGAMTGNSATFSSSIDKAVRDKCTAAKAAGIKIFTVAFMAPDEGKSLLQFCASAPANYYEPDTMDTLIAAFTSIATSATKSTSRVTN